MNRGHGHIKTGDLRFIENKHLISKESSFREAKTINWNIFKDAIRRE